MKRQRRFRFSCTTCGGGCLGLVALLFAVAAIWYSSVGRYRPRIPPLPPLPVPNAFDDYLAAGKMLQANGSTNAMYTNTGVSLTGEQSVVAKNQAVLVRLRQASGKACVVPMRSRSDVSVFDLDYTRDLARLLSGEADVKAAEGDFAGAFSASLDILQMGQDFSQNGGLIQELLVQAIQAIAHVSMLANIEKLPAADCDRVANRLQGLLKARIPYIQFLKEDCYSSLETLANRRGDESESQLNLSSTGQEAPGWEKYVGRIYWHAQRDRNLHELEDYSKALIAEEQKPYAARKPVPAPTSAFASILAPEAARSHPMFDVMDVRNRLFLIVLKIRSYRLKQGHLPATLDALGIESSLLMDPFSEHLLVYKPQGADYLLYSVGMDLKDNGGIPADEKSPVQPPPGDLGIRRFSINPSGIQSVRDYRLVLHMKPPVLSPGAPPLYH